MEINKARKILGKVAENITDNQIQYSIDKFKIIANLAIQEAKRTNLIKSNEKRYSRYGTHEKDHYFRGRAVNKSDPVEFPVRPLEDI